MAHQRAAYELNEIRQPASNTLGGPVHDAEQRILDTFGELIPSLPAAGELASVFGQLYMSGGNISECLFGRRDRGPQRRER